MTTVSDFVTSDELALIPANATVRAAADSMRRRRTALLVVVEDGRYLGALTDRDIAVKVAADGRDAATTQVRDVMAREINPLHEDQDVVEAATLMCRLSVLRLPVLDREARPIGVVALTDLALAAGAGGPAFAAETEKDLASGSP